MQKDFSEVIQELQWLEYIVQPVETELWRVQGVNGELPIGEAATSDEVINLSRAIDNMERELSFLAMSWRGGKAQETVRKYHEVLQELWKLGWRGTTLLPDTELPADLMPNFFVEYWKKRRQEHNEKHI